MSGKIQAISYYTLAINSTGGTGGTNCTGGTGLHADSKSVVVKSFNLRLCNYNFMTCHIHILHFCFILFHFFNKNVVLSNIHYVYLRQLYFLLSRYTLQKHSMHQRRFVDLSG